LWNVRHLDDGALRRLYDDPLAVSEPARAHFAACDECGRRFDAVAADARRAAALLQVPAAAIDTDAALARMHTRSSEAPAVALRPRLRVPWRAAAAVAAAAVAIVALAVTGTAQQLFTVLQPSSVQVVPVTTSELQAMPDLSQFGTIHWGGNPQVMQVADAGAAADAAGFAAPAATTPSAVSGQPQYGVLGQTTATFTFSAAKAQAWAAAHNVTLPAIPAGMDGSSLELTVGPAIVEVYGAPNQGAGVPQLAVGKMRAPTLASTGPSVKEIEDYLISIPSFPSDLAAQLRALGDPATTLPLPVLVDRASSQQVEINGVQGVVIGDNTGLGAGAIWVRDGYVYGVAGSQAEDTILSVAGSVH
jgi:hypothetical protein